MREFKSIRVPIKELYEDFILSLISFGYPNMQERQEYPYFIRNIVFGGFGKQIGFVYEINGVKNIYLFAGWSKYKNRVVEKYLEE